MEKPILFSGPMVQAILDGRKTQTRREMKFCKEVETEFYDECELREIKEYEDNTLRAIFDTDNDPFSVVSPYGKVSDVLWVRETWSPLQLEEGIAYRYKATFIENTGLKPKWRPSIFMPKEACRIKLLIKDIRVERLQDITKDENIEDIACEGISKAPFMTYSDDGEGGYWKDFETEEFKEAYQELWESINGKGSWEKNPWVWVIEFEEIKS